MLEAEAVRAKTNAEISAGCLQSLDDLEASYRKKRATGRTRATWRTLQRPAIRPTRVD